MGFGESKVAVEGSLQVEVEDIGQTDLIPEAVSAEEAERFLRQFQQVEEGTEPPGKQRPESFERVVLFAGPRKNYFFTELFESVEEHKVVPVAAPARKQGEEEGEDMVQTLNTSIEALNKQRQVLGDTVVDMAIQPLRERLSALKLRQDEDQAARKQEQSKKEAAAVKAEPAAASPPATTAVETKKKKRRKKGAVNLENLMKDMMDADEPAQQEDSGIADGMDKMKHLFQKFDEKKKAKEDDAEELAKQKEQAEKVAKEKEAAEKVAAEKEAAEKVEKTAPQTVEKKKRRKKKKDLESLVKDMMEDDEPEAAVDSDSVIGDGMEKMKGLFQKFEDQKKAKAAGEDVGSKEAEKLEREAVERKTKEEADRKEKAEEERKAKEEEEKKEAERKAKEEADKKEKERKEAEKKVQEAKPGERIVYAVVARGTTLLAEHSMREGTHVRLAAQVLRKASTEPDGKRTLPDKQGRFNFHYVCREGMLLLCFALSEVKTTVCFSFLEDVRSKFVARYGDKTWRTATAKFEDFAETLSREMRSFSDESFVDKRSLNITAKLEEVKKRMQEKKDKQDQGIDSEEEDSDEGKADSDSGEGLFF